MTEILNTLKEYGWTIPMGLIILGTFIEITPIKVNPLSCSLNIIKRSLRWLGRQMTVELFDEIRETQNELGELKERIEQSEKMLLESDERRDKDRIKDLRWEIIDFGNSVKSSTYLKEAFDHIFDTYEEYENLLHKYKMKNGQADRTMAMIAKIYNERQSDPNF